MSALIHQARRRAAAFTATLFLLAAGPVAHAAVPVVNCDRANYSVIYVNGVDNTPEDAAESLAGLRGVVTTELRNGRVVDFKYVYNRSRGRGEDFDETHRLKAIELNVDRARLLSGLDSGYFDDRGVELTDDQRRGIDNYYAATQAEAAALFLDTAVQNEPDFIEVVTRLRNPSVLPAENSVILVGHSEGTVFSELLYIALRGGAEPRSDESLRLLSVAAAARTVPGQSNLDSPGGEAWVTSDDDLVISTLRARQKIKNLPEPLRGNVNATKTDFLGHNFVTQYIENAALRAAIAARVNAFFDKMKVPSDGLKCTLKLDVTGSIEGWVVAPEVTLSDFVVIPRGSFPTVGSPNNTCSTGERERGIPLWSVEAPITPTARFYGAGSVLNPPYQANAFPNRRPCSSFVAYDIIPDPAKKQIPRYRIWANATGRSQVFTPGVPTRDWENQLRFDSGDPWVSGTTGVCDFGVVPNSNFFGKAGSLTCTARLLSAGP